MRKLRMNEGDDFFRRSFRSLTVAVLYSVI